MMFGENNNSNLFINVPLYKMPTGGHSDGAGVQWTQLAGAVVSRLVQRYSYLLLHCDISAD